MAANPSHNNSGFTLIELLVFVALMGIVAGVATDTFSNIMKAQNKANTINELEQAGNQALSVMEQKVRNAQVISACTSGTLTFTPAGGGDEESYDNTVVRSLVGGGVILNGPTFTCLSDDGSPIKSVDISFKLTPVATGSRQEFTSSEAEFRTTVMVRSSIK